MSALALGLIAGIFVLPLILLLVWFWWDDRKPLTPLDHRLDRLDRELDTGVREPVAVDALRVMGDTAEVVGQRRPDVVIEAAGVTRGELTTAFGDLRECLARGLTVAGRQVLAQGWAHVRSIQLNGQMILGRRDLGLDGIRGLREVTHRGGGTVMVYEGATPLRPATREEAATMPVFSTWGLKVISVLAERLFVKHLPLAE